MERNLQNNQDPTYLYSVVELCREQIKKLTGYDWIHNRVGDNVVIAEILNRIFPDGNFEHTIVGQYDILSKKYGNIDIKKVDKSRKSVTILDKIHDKESLAKFNKTSYFVLLEDFSYDYLSFSIMENGSKVKRRIRTAIQNRLKKEKSGKMKKYHSIKLSLGDIRRLCKTTSYKIVLPFQSCSEFSIRQDKQPIYRYDDEENKKNR